MVYKCERPHIRAMAMKYHIRFAAPWQSPSFDYNFYNRRI